MGKTKRRIDKKNSVTFKLVNRSQRDPLVADERAPQHVLVECVANKNDCLSRKEEQRKYGIYFDDDYDYLQHLKDVKQAGTEWLQVNDTKSNDKKKVLLPSSMFPSHVEEEEGMLNKAVLPVGPQVDWDPDVVAAMDDDFDFEDPNNIIDDDFILQAMGTESGLTDEEEEHNPDDNCSYSDVASFNDEETKSHFTNYSMTSSVLPRNKGLKLLDERFETMYEQEYAEDTDIGALDLENIEGCIDVNNCQVIQQLIKESAVIKSTEVVSKENQRIQENFVELEEENEFVELQQTSSKHQSDRFDCESILSTYSNLYNHPKLIIERPKLKIDRKSGIPVRDAEVGALTKRNLKMLNNTKSDESADDDFKSEKCSRMSELSLRLKDETPEERKLRKAAFKQHKRERREEKKSNKTLFKKEELRQNQEVLNLRNQLKAVKLL